MYVAGTLDLKDTPAKTERANNLCESALGDSRAPSRRNVFNNRPAYPNLAPMFPKYHRKDVTQALCDQLFRHCESNHEL